MSKYLDENGLSFFWKKVKAYIDNTIYGQSTATTSAKGLMSAEDKTTLDRLSVGYVGPGYHNSVFRGKSLGSSITTAQNTAIKNRTYDDMFIGDYWTINGHTWRIAAFDYYYKVGDTAFSKGNVIVVPDAQLYAAPMNGTSTTEGGYTESAMFTGESVTVSGTAYTGLTQARSVASNDFGAHVAAHRIYCANATASGKPSSAAWRDSDGVELMNEIQVYGTRVWGASDQNGFDVGTQKTQLPLFRISPTHINTRQSYWLQDVRSATNFAFVNGNGGANTVGASNVRGVRPAVTITYT